MKGTSKRQDESARGPIPKDGQTSITEASPSKTQRRTDRGRFADGSIKVVPDMSAEERFIARSQRIREFRIRRCITGTLAPAPCVPSG